MLKMTTFITVLTHHVNRETCKFNLLHGKHFRAKNSYESTAILFQLHFVVILMGISYTNFTGITMGNDNS
jgi:hypothetical protein